MVTAKASPRFAGFDNALARCQHAEMTVVLDKELETLIGRLVASGRFHTPHEAVGAGLRKLEDQEGISSGFESFPEGSLARFYTPENNSEERDLFKACSMAVEDE
jgi:Arc/MetJ-type ribon-helix-helix transcriptional regulator